MTMTVGMIATLTKYLPVLLFLAAAGIPPIVVGALILGFARVPQIQRFARDFEWTWTKAVVGSLLLWLMGMILIVIIPSYWLYFADQTLGWAPTKLCSIILHNCGFWLFELRDVVAIVLFSGPFSMLIVVSYYLQKQRRKLRSESESRPGGGYR
jgi:hypothetical protein